MAGPLRPQIVLFGSSIIQMSFDNGGWGAILANLYARKADIVLRGYSGWNSRRALEVMDEIFPKDASVQPSLVIVYFGGNDSIDPHPSGLGPHVPLQEYVENMRKIANHLKSLSDHIRVIFLTSPPINEEQLRRKLSATQSGRSNESCGVYANALMELCEEMNLKAINLWSAIQAREDWLDVSFTDGVHLSAEGSKVVVKEILRILREADWKTSPLRPQIVLFGSSIIQMSFDNGGWGAILANLYARKADIVLRGYSGWNSRRALEVMDEIFPKDASVQPSLVIVYFGGNDSIDPHPSGLGPHVPLQEYVENMRKIANHLKDASVQPSLVIVYFGGNDSIDPHPSGLGPHVPLQEYVENMRKIANHLKSLSDHIRVIFLTSPPINEEQLRRKLSATQSGRSNESCGVYANALMELCEEMNLKAINLWSAIQAREDWLDVSFTKQGGGEGNIKDSQGSRLENQFALDVNANRICRRFTILSSHS
ncbi:hypothetical protein LR48_Vigan03g086900 [Vigna angularis]|uniref:SGNH hydrolase-type esterase domain-containing protein n=1 Tax=Phaseolus angularis TaxID=3914 RepID=A0A0L9U498_PHAAN|nr:hypothetical protein LR48_Vigan03g086900 [Vigna angularis]